MYSFLFIFTLGLDRLKTTPDRSALVAGCSTTLTKAFFSLELSTFLSNCTISFGPAMTSERVEPSV